MAQTRLTVITNDDDDLPTLAAEANRYHAAALAAAGSAVEAAWHAGRALNDAKTQVQHGEWLSWLKANFDGSRRLAATYMQIAANVQCSAHLASFPSIDAALKAIAKPKREPPQPKPAPKADRRDVEDTINEFEDRGENYSAKDVVDALGGDISVDTVERKRKAVRAERKAIAEATPIDWASLPGTMQQKLERMRRQVRRELEAEFEPRVQAEVTDRIGYACDQAREMYADAERILYAQRKGIFTRAHYDLIRSCLHPDSRASASDQKLAEAFRIFNEATIVLIPTPKPSTLPSFDELLKMRKGKRH